MSQELKGNRYFHRFFLLITILAPIALIAIYALSYKNKALETKGPVEWKFIPVGSSNIFTVKIGDSLFKLLKNKAMCCSGYYITKIDVFKALSLENSQFSNFGLLLPATTGLKTIEINDRLITLPNNDYSSSGTIIGLSEKEIKARFLDLKIHITYDSVNFTGMWKGELILDSIQNLELIRDRLNLWQKFIPSIFAVIFVILSLIFKWINDNYRSPNIIYKEYFYGFIICSLTLFFLSGIPRAFFPEAASVFHYPVNSLGFLACFRIISTLADIKEKNINRLTLFLLLLIFLQIVFNELKIISRLDEVTLLTISIFSAFSLVELIIKNTKAKPIQLVSTIYVILNIVDSFHLFFAKENLSFPLPYFVRFTMPIFLFSGFFYLAKNLFDETISSEKAFLLNKIASQVSHDIRSPLSALEVISGSLNELPADKLMIIKNSINRIRDISNSLLVKNKTRKPTYMNQALLDHMEDITTILLSPLIDAIITEKRIQYRNQFETRIDFNQTKESYGLFAKIQPNEFQRMISNLIDNSIEAFKNHEGALQVILKTNQAKQIEILIKDNGRGIPQTILPKLGVRGETHGKEKGSGLGLSHAQETVQTIQGSLKIESKENSGTTITINIPLQSPPSWFVPKIELKPQQTFIIFDDDQSIHQIWEGRIKSLIRSNGIEIRNFSEPGELKKFYGKNFSELDGALFLMDYEINGTKETGLDVIEALGIQKQSILVTSRYEEKNIRQRCEKLGVRLIPKTMSGFVPMEIIS